MSINWDTVCVVFSGPHHASTALLLHHFEMIFFVLTKFFLHGSYGFV